MASVAIIGRGGMGKLFGKIISSDDNTVDYYGRQAAATDLSNYDIIVIATPSSAATQIDNLLAGIAKIDKKLVVCLWSYMETGVRHFDKNLQVVYVHLLFGPDIEQLTEQNIVMAGETENKLFLPLRSSLLETGARIHTSDPESHDRIMAYTQSLSQLNSILLAVSLAQSGYDRNQLQNYASLTFRLNRHAIERIMLQKPELWAELQFENEYYPEVLNTYLTNLKKMANIINSKDNSAFIDLFEEAANFWKQPAVSQKVDEINATLDTDGGVQAELITLGPVGTYSHEAALAYSGESQIKFGDSIQDVILAVVEDKSSRGIIPIENAIQGIVSESLDGLYMNSLIIEDEIVLDVNHVLCGVERPERKDSVKIVYSHPQALAQCRQYLIKNYPNVLLIPTSSTAAAMQKISDQKSLDALAIGPVLAAKLNGLIVLDRNIEDEPGNQTRFVIFSKHPKPRKLNFILLAAIPKFDRPGLLENILTIIKNLDINLSQIESRPDRTKLGSYIFYMRLDVENGDNRYDEIVKAADKIGVTIKRISV